MYLCIKSWLESPTDPDQAKTKKVKKQKTNNKKHHQKEKKTNQKKKTKEKQKNNHVAFKFIITFFNNITDQNLFVVVIGVVFVIFVSFFPLVIGSSHSTKMRRRFKASFAFSELCFFVM